MKSLWLGAVAVEVVVEVPTLQPRKVPKAVRLRREKDMALEIIADAEAVAFTQPLKVNL